MKMNKKGFTLIEMLVVIAIIAVLVAIIVPAVGSATMKASAATNAANLRSAAASITIDYANGTATVANDGTVSNYTISAPTEKVNANDGISGGAFSAKLVNGEIVVAFGTDGTIANYSSVAETGNAIGG